MRRTPPLSWHVLKAGAGRGRLCPQKSGVFTARSSEAPRRGQDKGVCWGVTLCPGTQTQLLPQNTQPVCSSDDVTTIPPSSHAHPEWGHRATTQRRAVNSLRLSARQQEEGGSPPCPTVDKATEVQASRLPEGASHAAGHSAALWLGCGQAAAFEEPTPFSYNDQDDENQRPSYHSPHCHPSASLLLSGALEK